jgi:hypothetical protein
VTPPFAAPVSFWLCKSQRNDTAVFQNRLLMIRDDTPFELDYIRKAPTRPGNCLRVSSQSKPQRNKSSYLQLLGTDRREQRQPFLEVSMPQRLPSNARRLHRYCPATVGRCLAPTVYATLKLFFNFSLYLHSENVV